MPGAEALSPTFCERCQSALPFGTRPPPPSGGVRSRGGRDCAASKPRRFAAPPVVPLPKRSSAHVCECYPQARQSRGVVAPHAEVRLHGFRALVGTTLRWYAIPSALPTVIRPAVYSSRRPTANPDGLRHNAHQLQRARFTARSDQEQADPHQEHAIVS